MICIIICLMTIFCSTSAKEEEKNLPEVCKEFNVDAGVFSDCSQRVIAVYFEFEKSQFEGCFNFFNITLLREEKLVDHIEVKTKEKHSAVLKFEDVALGVYSISIAPICNFSGCPVMIIRYGTLINMSSDACVPNEEVMNEISPTSKTYPTSPTKETHPTSPINETQPISPTKEIYPTSTINETHLTSPTKETHKTKGTKERTVLVVVVTISGSMLLGLVFFSSKYVFQ